MDSLQRREATLRNEIRILERQKGETEQEIERLNVSNGEQQKQINAEIRVLTKQKTDLIEEVEAKKTLLQGLTDSYEQAKNDLSHYKEKEMADANKRLEDIRTTASTIEANALAKEREVEERERAADVVNRQQQQWASKMREEGERFMNARRGFEEVRQEWYTSQSAREKEKVQLTDKIDKLKKESEEWKVKLQQQKQQHAEAAVRHTLREQDLQQRSETLDRKAKAQANRQIMLDAQKKQQDEENIRIQDRQGQLTRAVDEWRGKGVAIN